MNTPTNSEALPPTAGSRPSWSVANAALNRMRRACERGTGCHLTAEMIQHLSVSTIGDIWSEPDPEDENVRSLASADIQTPTQNGHS